MKNRFIHLATLLGFAAFASVSHADNSISTAIRISPSGVAPGLAINRAGDVDFYRLDFSSPGRFTVFSEGRTDTFGCLLNSSGGFLACNDDVSSSNLNFSITHEVSPGAFYVFRAPLQSHWNGCLLPANTIRSEPTRRSRGKHHCNGPLD
jgi:hypothetical protein